MINAFVPNEFILIVDNYKFMNSFESIRVTQSMENICGSIALKTTLFDLNNPFANAIFLESSFIATINGKPVCTGYVEDLPVSYSAKTMQTEIKGRDKTCDLVDCSLEEGFYVQAATAWNVLSILCNKFNIIPFSDITAEAELKTKIRKTVNMGDRVIDAITDICNDLTIMPVSYGDGKLTFTKGPSTLAPTILVPEMVLSAKINQNNTSRFRKYIVAGQGEGTDDKSKPEDFIQPTSIGENIDPHIKRYRPHVILIDGDADSNICERRAVLERNYRAGQSRSIEYVVEGWTRPTTMDPWKINENVIVSDPVFLTFRTLLIAEVIFMYDSGSGFKTKLKLVHPSTYAASTDIAQFTSMADKALS